MQLEIQALQESIDQRRDLVDHLKQIASANSERSTACDSIMNQIDKSRRQADQKMLEISSIPIKTRQKSAQVESSHNSMLGEERTFNTQLAYARETFSRLQSQQHDCEVEYQHLTNDIDGMIEAVSDLKRRTEELRRNKCCSSPTRDRVS
jgi:chromosome segregation ATPase